MAARFYKILFWATVGALPFFFVYNSELFSLLNCPKNGGRLDTFFLLITSLADGLWVVMIIMIVQSIKNRGKHEHGARHFGIFLLALLLGNIVLQSAKYLFDAPRPVIALGEQVCVLGQRLTSRSFPSGHSFSAMLLFMYLRPRRSVTAAAAITALSILAVLSRAYVGAHFPRDLIAGSLIAILSYLAAEFLIVKIRPWRISVNLRRLLLAIPGLGVTLVYIFAYHEKTRELEYLLTPLAWLVAVYWVGFIAYRAALLLREQPQSGTGSSRV